MGLKDFQIVTGSRWNNGKNIALCRPVISNCFSLRAALNCVFRSRRLTLSIQVTLIYVQSQTRVVSLIPPVLLMEAFCLLVCLLIFCFCFVCFLLFFVFVCFWFFVGGIHSGETLIPSHWNLLFYLKYLIYHSEFSK